MGQHEIEEHSGMSGQPEHMRQATTGGVCPGAERVARFTVSVPSLRRLPPPFAGAGRGSLLLEPFNGVILASKPRGSGECPIISF